MSEDRKEFDQQYLNIPITEDDCTCVVLFEDGEPCNHLGCLGHVTHPCEGCGRTGGRGVVMTTKSRQKMIELKCCGCGEVMTNYKKGLPLCKSCEFWSDNSIHLKRSDDSNRCA